MSLRIPRPIALIAVLALAGSASIVPAQERSSRSLDRGSFIFYVGDKAVGAETFGIQMEGDSMTMSSRSYRTLRTQAGDEQIEKRMAANLGRGDYLIHYYQSNETYRGQTIVKGVLYEQGDTALTIYREKSGLGGEADRLVAPAGRFFVLDSGLYTLFNVICLNLHPQTFSERPINLVTLGTRDTLVEAVVKDLGRETIRWGARPVQARKLSLSQGPTEFLAWMDPSGRMLRLTNAASGLRVERDPPAVKRRSAPPKK